MPTLRSGLVIAGGYADKVRRVLFAQLRDQIKRGEIESREVARAAAELNRLLFEIIVNRLKIDKGDVVRVTVDYDVEDGTVKWHLDTLRLEAWRRVPQEEVDAAVKAVVEGAEELLSRAVEYEVEKLGETDTGDLVYVLRHQGREVGALLVTPLDGQAVVRGAAVEPTPVHLKRTTITYEGDLDEYLKENVTQLMARAENVERREADRVVREILALVRAAEEGEAEAEEEY